jgi:hypothetical protein
VALAELEFYHPLPEFGNKLTRQWGKFRDDFDSLATLIRAATADISGTTGQHDLAGWAVGELDFRNRFQIFYDKDVDEFKVRLNQGTESAPVWLDCLRIRESDHRVVISGEGGLEVLGGFYNVVFPTQPAAVFYGISVKHSDDSTAFKGINTLSFESASFYVTQNDPNTDEAIINFRGSAAGGSGETNTASNLSGDEGVFSAKVGVDLQFKSLTAGSGIDLSSDANTVTITSLGGGGFYGITAAQTDGLQSFTGLNKLNFEADNFYVTQNSSNTDEAIINFRGDKTVVSAGSNVTVAQSGNTWTVSADVASSDITPGFYGVTAAQTDGLQSFEDLVKLNFNSSSFYLTQNTPNTDEVIINLRNGTVGPTGPQGDAGPEGAGFYGIDVSQTDELAAFIGIRKLNFETLNFYVTQNAPNTDEVTISFRGLDPSAGEANTASNLGGDEGLFTTKSGVDLPFKGLTAGDNITLTPSGTDITIAATGGGGGFYGVVFRESESGGAVYQTDAITFDSDFFYLTTGGDGKPILSEIHDSALPGLIPDVSVRSFSVDPYAFFRYDVDSVFLKTASGTASVGFYIREQGEGGTGTSIQGLDPITVTSTGAVTPASGANSVSLSNELIMSVFSESTAIDLSFSVRQKRKKS